MTELRKAAMLGLLTAAGCGLLTSCKSDVAPPASVPTVPVIVAEAATLENDIVLTAEFRPY